MAKNKKKQKNTSQEYFNFPEYIEVSSEDEALIKQIKNPFIISYGIAGASIISGIVLFALAYFLNTNLLRYYYYIFALIAIVYGLSEFYFTYSKHSVFSKFIKRKKYRIIWTYSDTKYDEFYKAIEKTHDKSTNKSFIIVIALMFLATLMLYFTLEPSVRFVAIPFGIICIGVVLVTGLIIPWSYLYDARKKPYITLIDDNAAYALGRFYKWKKAHVKFEPLNKKYGIDATEMDITYQEPGLLGKKTPTFQVLIPNNDPYTLQYARRVGKRINLNREALNNGAASEDGLINKAFKKMLGNTEEE